VLGSLLALAVLHSRHRGLRQLWALLARKCTAWLLSAQAKDGATRVFASEAEVQAAMQALSALLA
jgi:hypothetical protein